MPSILLIDDDDAYRKVIAEILREGGYRVNEAPDGKRGLALNDAEKHDLIITDIVMPDMDGLEFILTLANRSPRPHIIAISGDAQFAESLYLPTVKQLGIEGTLVKPIQPVVLMQTVAKVLAGPAPGGAGPKQGSPQALP